MASLRTQPLPGWTATADDAPSSTTPHRDARRRRSAATSRSWSSAPPTAAASRRGSSRSSRSPGGPFPDAERADLPRRCRLYSDGSEAAWIEPTVEGQAEPERPAPVLSLAAEQRRGTDGAATEPTADDTRTTRRRVLAGRGWRSSCRSSRCSPAIGGAVLGLAGQPTYRVLVSSAVRRRLRPALAALLVAAGLVAGGLRGRRPPRATSGHDHADGAGRRSRGRRTLRRPRPRRALPPAVLHAHRHRRARRTTSRRPPRAGRRCCSSATRTAPTSARRRWPTSPSRCAGWTRPWSQELQVVFVTTDPAVRHPGGARRVPRPLRRRPAHPVHRAHRRPGDDRPGPAVDRRAAGRGRRPAALVVTAAVRIATTRRTSPSTRATPRGTSPTTSRVVAGAA